MCDIILIMIPNKDISIHILKQEDIPMLQEFYPYTISYELASMLYHQMMNDITYGVYKETELVGIIQLYERDNDVYEIGYRTKHLCMHKGYMSTGVQLVVETNRDKKIYAKVEETNIFSIKILENTGFLLEVNKDGVLIYGNVLK